MEGSRKPVERKDDLQVERDDALAPASDRDRLPGLLDTTDNL